MKHLISALLVAFGLVSVAQATDATITCTGPTKYDDGTLIPTGKTITYSLYGALQGAPKTKLATSPTCTFLRTALATGTQEWYVTATIDAVESLPSVVVSKVITPPAPQPPSNVTVTTSVAYEYRPSTKTFAAIGLVPEGVTCGPETLASGSTTYCRVKLSDALPIVWPQNRSLREVWVVQPNG